VRLAGERMRAMPIMSDALFVHELEPYALPRGTCPRCGSGDVRHLMIGMPAHPQSMDSTPRWVEWVGCMHPGHDRECDGCGLDWTDDAS
jgi:hypothetical protein